MPTTEIDPSILRRRLRLWPGVIAVVFQWIAMFVVPVLIPDAAMLGVLGGLVGGMVVLLWWLFFSRARWLERLGALLLMLAGVFATSRIVHQSVADGMMGMMLAIYAIPVLSLTLVAWAVATQRLSDTLRRASLLAMILLACGLMASVRTGGITGNAVSDLHWRWTRTPEERLLAQEARKRTASPLVPAGTNAASLWPGFRGPRRDGRVESEVLIQTNWAASMPIELWRRPVGPAWSSFSVQGDFIYTQEQRGEDELVACYQLSTGAPVWTHGERARFWESNAGAGPRGTPTLHGGRVFAFGGTGILNALESSDGSLVWSRNAASDTKKKVPGWGFSSSPLLVDELVVIATAGMLAAYDRDTGKLRWTGPPGDGGYSSPQLANINGVQQILLLNSAGATAVSTDEGRLLWQHPWPGDGIVQPALLSDGDLLLGSGSGMGSPGGVRRISVSYGPNGWRTQERWTTRGLKPYYNDFVIHQGHAYGFDGNSVACIRLLDGQRRWKGGRYGYGQLLGLPGQDLLLVLSEKGEVALVQASPNSFAELSRFSAINGKTWNHPALVGDILLVRNAQEMAAFRLPTVKSHEHASQ